MTGTEFRQNHGDPATWTDDAYELYAHCATPGDPAPEEVIAFLKQPPPARTTDPGTIHGESIAWLADPNTI